MRYWYIVIEGGGVKGAKFMKSEVHPLTQPLLSKVLTDFARAQSLKSSLIVDLNLLFVSWVHELEPATAASIWPNDARTLQPRVCIDPDCMDDSDHAAH